MEHAAQYQISGQPLTLVRGAPCTLAYSDPAYKPPSPGQVDALIKGMGWSQSDVAKLVGVSYTSDKGSTAVRKWRTALGSAECRAIPYAAWRLLLLEAGLAQPAFT